MNYIWELAIKAKNQGYNENDIYFKKGDKFSPYMELSMENLNEKDILSEIEINPYYRYYNIFHELFSPDFIENKEIIEVIHDLTIHHLKDIDLFMGMSKREYYINFIINDLKNGIFGEYVKEKLSFFSNYELKIVANNLLNLFVTGEGVYLLKDTIKKIFTNTYIFSNAAERDEVIFFLRTKETKEKSEKISVIKYLFLPFKYTVLIYWEHIFGIIGIDELMKNDEVLNY